SASSSARDRQRERERRAPAGACARGADSPAVRLADMPADRQSETTTRERPPPAGACARGADSPAVRLDDMPADRQSETTTAERSRTIALVEPLEDTVELVRRDALAGVAYGEGDRAVGASGGQMDLAAVRSVFRRVVHQVCENLCDAFPVGGDGREPIRHVEHKKQASTLDGGLKPL